MITAFSSEDSGGADFNNRLIEATQEGDGGKRRRGSLRFAPYPGKCPPRRIADIATRNVFDAGKLTELSDEAWIKLAEPIDYSGIKFEIEIYRSGKKHIKKIRYKENPLGKIVGHHDGAQFYTIGQRKGLNIGGHQDSIFVIGTDIDRNIIYVGEGHGHKGLSRCCVRIAPKDIHWIRQDLEMADGEIRRYRVRIRYRQPLQDAWLVKRPVGLFILFDTPQRGISSGQFAAWYSEDDEMLGSGVY
ncbi:MAG: hypothetical protein K6F06_10245 [Bacteroidales bacterium]|nr:hypothetical protein [Bacteroidales bacterium]